jgi:hypothetical protein
MAHAIWSDVPNDSSPYGDAGRPSGAVDLGSGHPGGRGEASEHGGGFLSDLRHEVGRGRRTGIHRPGSEGSLGKRDHGGTVTPPRNPNPSETGGHRDGTRGCPSGQTQLSDRDPDRGRGGRAAAAAPKIPCGSRNSLALCSAAAWPEVGCRLAAHETVGLGDPEPDPRGLRETLAVSTPRNRWCRASCRPTERCGCYRSVRARAKGQPCGAVCSKPAGTTGSSLSLTERRRIAGLKRLERALRGDVAIGSRVVGDSSVSVAARPHRVRRSSLRTALACSGGCLRRNFPFLLIGVD